MSYNTIAVMARDADLQQRFIACAAKEGLRDPQQWVMPRIWTLVSHDGLPDAYQSAVDSKKITPGALEEVIGDAALLEALQAVVQAETPAPPVE